MSYTIFKKNHTNLQNKANRIHDKENTCLEIVFKICFDRIFRKKRV